MVKREFNADYLNEIVNDPSVRGGIKNTLFDLDMSPIVDEMDNYVLSWEGGAFILVDKGESVHELHTQALKSGRGKKLRVAADEMFEYMHGKCEKITSMASKDNPAARALAEEYMIQTHEDDEYYYFERVM
jgi:hypothetical protein|tara:strand:+ start:2984 stop:3376 length:393 start_codon:yes stop_codon:yes gene_type:complete